MKKEILHGAVVRKLMAFGCGLAVAGAAMANTVYVSAENGDDETGDGSQEHPMKTIQAGVDKLVDGWPSELWIDKGIYKLDQPIRFSEAGGQNYCIVRSMSGNPADVVIDGQDKVRCIECVGYNTVFRDLTVQNGFSAEQGAGMFLSGTKYVVSNCVVRNCHSVSDGVVRGGGLYSTMGLTLIDTTIADCSAESTGNAASGGGFMVGYWYNEPSESTSTICNCDLSNCVAKSASDARGGGAFLNRANVDGLVAVDCKALNTKDSPSSATGEGGGIYKFAYAENTFENVLVSNCLSNASGAGLLVNGNDDVVLHIRNCSFVDNRLEAAPSTADVNGGGVYCNGAHFDIAHCNFAGNRIITTASNIGNGAGLYLRGEQSSLVDSALLGNVTENGYGGGVYVSAPVVISNCVIAANVASSNGAFDFYFCKGALMTDVFCISNTADSCSIGRVFGTETYPTVIRNSYFTGNGGEVGSWHSSFLAASFGEMAPISFEYCTFVSNLVNSSQAYVIEPQVDNPGALTPNVTISNLFVKGCVFSSNSDKLAFPNCMSTVTNISYTYADDFNEDWWTEERRLHNYDLVMLGGVPPFVDLATDRRLKAGTPFIDEGVDEDWMGTGKKKGPLDMGDGSYRIEVSGKHGVTIVRNNPVPRVRGGTVDYGCFEFNSIPGSMLFLR